MGELLDLVGGHRRVSIVGMCKNAGKTTVLNKLISECASRVPAALCSVGRDGEKRDVISGLKKPGIFIEAGTLFATTTGLLERCEVEAELVLSTGFGTPLGEVVALRALSGGFVELSGPSMNARLPELFDLFMSLGAGMILIDGAVSRKASVSPAVAGCSILCVGADYDPDMRKAVSDTAHTAALLGAPGLPDDTAADVSLTGAVTDSVCDRIAGGKKRLAVDDAAARARTGGTGAKTRLVADDASKLMLSREALARLRAGGFELYVRDPVKLACICINPHCTLGRPDFNKGRFLREMQEATDTPVVNVEEWS